VGCNTSGVLTANSIVSTSRSTLVSVHATAVGNALFTFKVWDSGNTTVSGKKEMLRMNLKGDAVNAENDMHRAIAAEGLYFQITAGAGFVTINFA
jgi:hypothetical protein|tara:strand:+ start:6309 stop:6593 length:285 start_codon:yes stop_codon:yes gene_type:complete